MKLILLTLLLLSLTLRALAQADTVRQITPFVFADTTCQAPPHLGQIVSAQVADTIRQPGRIARNMTRITSTRAYRMSYVAVPLIAVGAIIQGRDREFRTLRHGYVPTFRHHYDDYLQYAPAGIMLGIKASGIKGRSSWGRMLVSDAFSAGVMALAVNSLKYSVRVERPDGSSRNSFPSGHTATAFMTATMLHKEYGGRSPWYSVGGYTIATFTGVSRMLNNRHWLSDVMVGAGIGILSTEVGYLLADLIFKERGMTYYNDEEFFNRYRRPSFLGLALAVDVIPGTYHPAADQELAFSSGVSTNVEGAWFFSTYAGVGAQLGAGCLPFLLNGEAQVDRLKTSFAYLNVYGSYPITARWLIGGKVMGGYGYIQKLRLDELTLGGYGGFSCGAGTAMTFRANESLDVRFCCDYRLLTAPYAVSRERAHQVSFSMSLNIAFN